MTQMTLFGDAETLKKARKVHINSSGNPIVFRDYASFVAKFTEQPKTTDDCYTPEDVYNAVVEYVGTITDMTGKCILRPFYPGGDYENAEYPDNGIVIDNPPFSMFTKIVRWYLANDVPFFLFGNGMTIMQICKYGATAVITGGGCQVPQWCRSRNQFCNQPTAICHGSHSSNAHRCHRSLSEPKPKGPPSQLWISREHRIGV